MDERAAIPLTLPRANPTLSYWQDPPDADIADYASGERVPEIADVVVIGSGISGASIAWGLLGVNGHGRVLMLEARQACSGATGRNGGHTKAASYRSFLDNTQSAGVAEAIKIARLEHSNIKSLHAFSREHDIDCDLFSGDTVDVIYNQAQWDTAIKSVTAIREAMPEDLDGAADYTIWSKEEARERFFVQGEECIGALSYQAGSLSAYKFVIALLKMCLEKGLQLYTNTPATSIERDGDSNWRVETSRGTIKASRVVLATNGYTGFLLERFRKVIVPLRGQITAHRPGSNMPTEGLRTTYSFIYRDGYEYMISRPKGSKFEGDIVIGGGLVKADNDGLEEYGTTDDTTLNPDISKYLAETTPRYFRGSWGEDHADGRIRKEWTGIMGYSSDGFPFVGEVPGEKGLWMSASFQGHGMVLCFLCAKALVEMMSDEQEELKSWFPDSFMVSVERMRKRFLGRLHTKPMERSMEA